MVALVVLRRILSSPGSRLHRIPSWVLLRVGVKWVHVVLMVGAIPSRVLLSWGRSALTALVVTWVLCP